MNEYTKYESIDDIYNQKWDNIVSKDNICLQYQHLRALEKSRINKLRPYYLTQPYNGSYKSAAYFFIIDFDLSTLYSEISNDVLSVIKTWFPDFLTMKMLESGVISGLGESFILQDRDVSESLPLLVQRMEEIAFENEVDFILIRDIPYTKFQSYNDVLMNEGYLPCLGFPTTKLNIQWNSFDDYIAAFKNKTRTNINHHLKKIQSNEITIEKIVDYQEHAERLEQLWQEVHTKADEYEHEILSKSYFYELSKNMKEKSYIIAIKRHGEIIAYGLCLDNGNELVALHIGIDYNFSKEYDLYFNIILLTIKQGIQENKLQIDFGITSYNFKLFIGCELKPLVYFIKHMKNAEFTQSLSSLLNDSIKQPQNKHRVFKNQTVNSRIELGRIQSEIAQYKNSTVNKNDIFNKTSRYTRANIARLSQVYNYFPIFESSQKPTIQNLGKSVVMLGSNSYLGLGSHPDVIEAAKNAIDIYGTGCTGSPILNGTLDLHAELCHSLARYIGKEAAMFYSTGYLTNLGVISTLVGRHDVVITDSLNHASIIDGTLFSRGQVERYKHDDFDQLEFILEKHKDRPKLVVVDSVFSMEGTIINLPEIVERSKKYGARIMVDEAHGFGVLGDKGIGGVDHFGLIDEVDIIMGTFSKSFAAIGGFIATEAKVVDYLKHVSRPHLFTASLPPSAIATVRKALNIIMNEPGRRQKVLNNAKFMAENLQKLGYEAPFQGTAVVPVYCRDETLTFMFHKKLYDEGVYTNPVISPGVPKGDELLRTSYMATHDEKDLLMALNVFKKLRTINFPKNRSIKL